MTCHIRGDCEIVRLSEAPIPWPIGRSLASRRWAMLVYGDLAEAVGRESEEAVCYWWGVGTDTAWRWRKALGVGALTEGTRRLKSEVFTPVLERAREVALPTLSSPERRAKIAAAKRGKPRPPHVVEALRKSNTGRVPTAEARRKMSETHRARGSGNPNFGTRWTEQEDDLVRTLPPAEVAAKTGRTLTAVWSRRRKLGLPDGRGERPLRGAVLTEGKILGWARQYRRREGRWPSAASGAVALPEGESWKQVDACLRRGLRGLHGGSSLSRLLRGLKGRRAARADRPAGMACEGGLLDRPSLQPTLSGCVVMFAPRRSAAVSRSGCGRTPRTVILRRLLCRHRLYPPADRLWQGPHSPGLMSPPRNRAPQIEHTGPLPPPPAGKARRNRFSAM